MSNTTFFWFIFAQVFGLLSLIIVFITFQTRNKIKLLVLDALANLFMAIAYFAMGSLVLAIINTIACFRDVAFAHLNKCRANGKVHPFKSIGLLFIFLLAFTISILLVWETWFDLVILGLVLLYVLALWGTGVHSVRLLCFLLSIMFIIVNVLSFNIMGIVAESVYVISIFVFYFKALMASTTRKKHLKS